MKPLVSQRVVLLDRRLLHGDPEEDCVDGGDDNDERQQHDENVLKEDAKILTNAISVLIKSMQSNDNFTLITSQKCSQSSHINNLYIKKILILNHVTPTKHCDNTVLVTIIIL